MSFVFILALAGCLLPLATQAYPSFFDSRCATCHSDDTPFCDACHEHHENISAEVDQVTYDPGSIVTVALDGGSRGGSRPTENTGRLLTEAALLY